MKRLFAVLALLFLAGFPARLSADPADIAAASRSVVRVVLIAERGDGVELIGHGSGVAIGPNLILTNAHVVAPLADDDSLRVGVVPSQGKTGFFAKIVAFSPQKDLALIRLTEPGSIPVATLYTGAVGDGADVVAVGYPGNVDAAQGLQAQDIMSPTTPVKSRGSVSAGRASRSFDTLLHTAPIGAGNSGGPLLDPCGRVLGINSFGTEAASGADSEFYFAVSMREVTRFLTGNGIQAQLTGEPCRSQADFANAEQARLAGERAAADEAARSAAATRDATLARATRQAELEVLSSRENGMALAGLAVLLAVICGGAGAWLLQRDEREREARIAFVLTGVLIIGAIVAWVTRPGIETIDARAQDIAETNASPSASASAAPAAAAADGELVCVIDPGRSRVTVSSTQDVPLTWSADGCVNGRSQYGRGADGWSRVLVPNGEDTVTVARFDPASRTYRTDRYLLDAETIARARAERGKIVAPACGAGPEAAAKLGEAQSAVTALLPPTPNERLTYTCSKAP